MTTLREMTDAKCEAVRTRTGQKHLAQEMIMHGVALVLGYWNERDPILVSALGGEETPEAEEFQKILNREADRVARLFGYDQAWGA